MDIVLITVTLGSLAVALAASVFAWRMSQQEKQRAAARVAALGAAAGVPAEAAAEPAGTAPLTRPSGVQWRTSGMSDPVRAQSAGATGASEWAPALPPPGRAAATGTGSTPLPVSEGFLATEAAPSQGVSPQRWLAAAALLVAVLLGGFVLTRLGNDSSPAAAARQPSTPLELLSLRHEREGANLAVAGLVRNPSGTGAVARLSAVVLLFDQKGAFVTSATAPIDFRTLSAGEESPFVVKVAAPQAVARYRVSFRTDEGTLPHVDRRAEQGTPPVAVTGGAGVKGNATDVQD